MKYIDEYRKTDLVRLWSQRITSITQKEWTIMEVCGGQTHSILKFGLLDLLPKKIHLIHGPGCPVCVTPISLIDHALFISSCPNTILCSFGDMLRVPGSTQNLLTAKAKGSDIRLIHSPLDALTLAKENPEKEVVLFAVGFETTAPATAMTLLLAKQCHIANYSLLSSHVLVPPALRFLIDQPETYLDGFLAAGHVCTVMGYTEYTPLEKPIVVTGFEPVDILQGIYHCIKLLETNQTVVQNQYQRCVKKEGNKHAQECMREVFSICDRAWRGIGMIPKSGLEIKNSYKEFDATLKFPYTNMHPCLAHGCISGLILQGKKRPNECPCFGKECTPERPLGAPMVSSEGACAAYYNWSKT